MNKSLPEVKCPTCGSQTTYYNSELKNKPPKPHDLLVCTNCADLLEFDNDLTLHIASLDTLVSLTGSQHSAIAHAQTIVRNQERKS